MVWETLQDKSPATIKQAGRAGNKKQTIDMISMFAALVKEEETQMTNSGE